MQITWPHEAFDSILGKKTYSYSNLSFPAMMAGMLEILRESSDIRSCPVSVKMFLDHLSLLSHAESVTQDTVTTMEFNRSILSYIESGQLSWSEAHKPVYDQLKVHFLAGVRSSPGKGSGGGSSGSDRKDNGGGRSDVKKRAQAVVCRAYGAGKCRRTGEHDGRLHVCYHCLVSRDVKEEHPRGECPHGSSA